ACVHGWERQKPLQRWLVSSPVCSTDSSHMASRTPTKGPNSTKRSIVNNRSDSFSIAPVNSAWKLFSPRRNWLEIRLTVSGKCLRHESDPKLLGLTTLEPLPALGP